jgi:hypothetical protein
MTTPTNRIIEALDRGGFKPKEKSQGQWESCCPAHNDRKPSLAITSGEDGKCAVFCHAGCDPEDIVSGISLKLTDLFPAKTNGRRRAPKAATTSNGNGNGQRQVNGNGCAKVHEIADPATLDRAYTALVEVLTLSSDHKDDLLRRGFSEADIASGRYRTIPNGRRTEIARSVQEAMGSTDDQILAVPGFARGDDGHIKLSGWSGLLIPMTGFDGVIFGCQIRPDDPTEDTAKYQWLSSSSHGGPSITSAAHVPPGVTGVDPSEIVRVTEGPLKAHIATIKSGMLTIGVPGVSAAARAIPTLTNLGAKTVRLAFDADAATNKAVARSLAKAVRGFVVAGFDLELERWNPSEGKGIDDVLVAGGKIEVMTGLDAVRSSLTPSRELGATVAVEPDQLIVWVEWYLTRKLTVELYRDHELLAASGSLEKSNPTQFAELISLLERQKVGKRAFLKAAKHAAKGIQESVAFEERYVERGGITYACFTNRDDEVVESPIANFTARVVSTIRRHEGEDEKVRYKIAAKHSAGHERQTVVEADKYPAMGWVYGLGAEFAIEPGRDSKDSLRHAIQFLSEIDGISRETEHTSLGWIKSDGRFLYLHAGGAIGESGPSDLVKVDIPAALGKYRLPIPPSDKAILTDAIEAHFDIWSLGKRNRPGGRSAAAIVAILPTRAVLSASDFAIHFGGPSGNRKTSTARIAYQHLGIEVQGRNFPMPAGWNDTANALQRLCYDCRDSLLIVDDLKRDRQVQTAEIVIQAQGNLQNRMRMNIDQSLQRTLDPRGSLLSTGELDPKTQSPLGRILDIEIKAGDIDTTALARIQKSGDKGLFALMMAAYIQWLAPRLDAIREDHATLTSKIRSEIGDIKGSHPRHTDIVAQLVAAYEIFLRFAVEQGAIEQVTAEAYARNARQVLLEIGEAQTGPQEESKAGRRFLELIASALQAGRCHLVDAESGLAPFERAGAFGWQQEATYQGGGLGTVPNWRIPSGSRCVGFISSIDRVIYLLPGESELVAREGAQRRGDLQSFASVGRELLNEQLCMAHSEGGTIRSSKNIRIKGRGTVRCLWVPIDKMFESETDPDVPTVPTSDAAV